MRGVGLLLVSVALETVGCGAATELDTRDRARDTGDGGGLPATQGSPSAAPAGALSDVGDEHASAPGTTELSVETGEQSASVSSTALEPEPPTAGTDDDIITDDVITDDDVIIDDTEPVESTTDVDVPASSSEETEAEPEAPNAECAAFSIALPTAPELANTTSYKTVMGDGYCRRETDYDADGCPDTVYVRKVTAEGVGHLIITTDLDSSGNPIRVSSNSYEDGKLDHSLTTMGAEVLDSTTYVTDSQGRVVSEVRYVGSSSDPDLIIETTYDDANNTQTDSRSEPSSGVTLIVVKTFDETGRLVFDDLQDAAGATYEKHQFTFDAAGNILQSLYTGSTLMDDRYSYDCADE